MPTFISRKGCMCQAGLHRLRPPSLKQIGPGQKQVVIVKDVDYSYRFVVTATSNACFWVWVHILVNLVAMAFLFTMSLCLPWVLNFNLSQARLHKETACNYVFSVLVHGIPSNSAWISIHQNSQKLFCAKTSIGH